LISLLLIELFRVDSPHVYQPVATLPEPLLTKLTLVSFYLEVDIPNVDVQAGVLTVAVWTYTATVACSI
jgi:hypothetical protein